MDRGNTALLDSRDEAERQLLADQLLIANRFCSCNSTNWRQHRASVTWAPDRKYYTVEAGNEQIARWAGFEVLDDEETWDEENGREPVWHGTKRTERGTYAAQFEVGE